LLPVCSGWEVSHNLKIPRWKSTPWRRVQAQTDMHGCVGKGDKPRIKNRARLALLFRNEKAGHNEEGRHDYCGGEMWVCWRAILISMRKA
jgi:hypothetical protein